MVYRQSKKLPDGTTKEYLHYWYRFMMNGELIRKNTKQPNKRVAEQLEAEHRTRIARGEAGLRDPNATPTLKEFAQQFNDGVAVRCAEKPRTVDFYRAHFATLCKFQPLAGARLDRIDERLVEKFVQHRITEVSPAMVNRSLATLRRALRLANEWKLINAVPKIRMLPGERHRDFVVSRELECHYLAAAPQPLRDVALLIPDTGLRVGEALALEWDDVKLDPVGSARFGFVRIWKGKTRNARRNVSLTPRVRAMLAQRRIETINRWVFPSDADKPVVNTSIAQQHAKLRAKLQLPEEFVVHSLRHTMLTRLGEAGVEAFTIMRIAGHGSITISQRYVHPMSEAMERAFERFEAFNRGADLHTTGIPRSESGESPY